MSVKASDLLLRLINSPRFQRIQENYREICVENEWLMNRVYEHIERAGIVDDMPFVPEADDPDVTWDRLHFPTP